MGFLSRLNQVATLCIGSGSSGCLKWFDASACGNQWKNYPRKSADLSKQRPSKILAKQQVFHRKSHAAFNAFDHFTGETGKRRGTGDGNCSSSQRPKQLQTCWWCVRGISCWNICRSGTPASPKYRYRYMWVYVRCFPDLFVHQKIVNKITPEIRTFLFHSLSLYRIIGYSSHAEVRRCPRARKHRRSVVSRCAASESSASAEFLDFVGRTGSPAHTVPGF